MTEVSDRSVTLESGRTQQDERHNRQRGNGSRHDPSAHDIADPREQSGSFNHRPNNDRSPATLIRTPVIVGRLIPASLRNPGPQETDRDGEIHEGQAGGHIADEGGAAAKRPLGTEQIEEGGAHEDLSDHERHVKDPCPTGSGDG